MDSQVYVHDEYDGGDISPEVVSQELDNVIQSYDTNDGGYAHDSYQHEEKRNGTASPKSDDQFKAKRKRKRDLPNDKERSHFDNDIQAESPPLASSPPPDWSRTAKDYLKITIIILTIFTFVLNVGPFKRFKGNPLFNKTRGETSRKYPIPITPIREVFIVIWPVIYAFQGLWMGLCFVSIFTKTKRIKYVDGMKQTEFSFLCRYPDVFSTPMLIFYAIGQLAITAYKFANDREELMLSFVFLLISSLFFHLSLASAVKGVHESWDSLTRDQVEIKFSSLLKAYKWMLRLFYINGIAIIATWNLVASSLSLCKFLLYENSRSMPQIPEVAIAVTVCVISSYAVTFFIIDVFVVNEATKWIYTSYGALLAASIGSFFKIWTIPRMKWNKAIQVQFFFITVLMAAVIAVAFFKIVTHIVRAVREQRRKDKDIDALVKKNGLTSL